MNTLYNKSKDLVLIRRTSDNKEFEEYPLIVVPTSVLMTDPANNVVCVSPSTLSVREAISSSYANTSSWARFSESASVTNYITQSIVSSSFANSASWASSSISASYAATSSVAGSSMSASYFENTNALIDGEGSASFNTLDIGSGVFNVSAQGDVVIPDVGTLQVYGPATFFAGVTGSLLGTASWANNVKSASYLSASRAVVVNLLGGNFSDITPSGALDITHYNQKWLDLDNFFTSSAGGATGAAIQINHNGNITADYTLRGWNHNTVKVNGNLSTNNLTVIGQVSTAEVDGITVIANSSSHNTVIGGQYIAEVTDGDLISGHWDLIGIDLPSTSPVPSDSRVLSLRAGDLAQFQNGMEVTGSIYTNGLITANRISCSIITASLFNGTASYANRALSASYAPSIPSTTTISASWASSSLSASFALSASYSQTASFANQALSASYALSASWASVSLTTSYVSSSATFDTQVYNLTASYALNSTNASILSDSTTELFQFDPTGVSTDFPYTKSLGNVPATGLYRFNMSLIAYEVSDMSGGQILFSVEYTDESGSVDIAPPIYAYIWTGPAYNPIAQTYAGTLSFNHEDGISNRFYSSIIFPAIAGTPVKYHYYGNSGGTNSTASFYTRTTVERLM